MRKILLLCVCLGYGVTLSAQGAVMQKVVPSLGRRTVRVPGADISALSIHSKRWGQIYRLNERYLQSVRQQAGTKTKKPFLRPGFRVPESLQKYFRDVAKEPKAQARLEKFFSNWEARLGHQRQALEILPNKGQSALEMHTQNAPRQLAKQLAQENLVLVGEIHGNLSPRMGLARVLKEVQAAAPGRKIVVFAEALYLKPSARERVFPYVYSRTTQECVEPPFNCADTNSPNARILHPQQNFRDMFLELDRMGVEIYPVEDAVVAQTLAAQGRISTVLGLRQRNQGFARVMRAQMKRIRKQDPNTLFVFFGGMSHVSWNMPSSLARMLSVEKPVVVEAVADDMAQRTFSGLPEVWGKNHPAFSSTGQERLFMWKNGRYMPAREWGKSTGFDYRIIFP